MRPNELAPLALALALLPAPACRAEDDAPAPLELSNAIRLNYASSDRVLSRERDFLLATFESKAAWRFSPQVRGALMLRAGSRLAPGSATGAELPYAYLDVRAGALDLRVGKQILAWGKTDAINPTDLVTPRDYTTLLPFDEDERSGTWGVRGTWYGSETLFATVFLGSRFSPSTLPFVSRDSQVYRIDDADGLPRQRAVRIGTAGGGVDFSLSAYRGPSLLAQAERSEQPAPGASVVTLRHRPIRMWGADLAGSVGKVGVRAEFASVRPDATPAMHDDMRDGMRAYRYLVVGADRGFFSDLNVNVQLFGRWSEEAAGDTVPARLNGVIFAQARKRTHGVTVRVANQWRNQTVSAELFAQHYLSDGSTYLRPMAGYAVNDRVKVTAGAAWYLGRPGTMFGVMRRNNGVFAEVRYSF